MASSKRVSEWRKPLGVNVLEAAALANCVDVRLVHSDLCVVLRRQRLHCHAPPGDGGGAPPRPTGRCAVHRLEAQYALTIEHVAQMFDRYEKHIDPYWVALPLTTTTAVSMIEPEWTCWIRQSATYGCARLR